MAKRPRYANNLQPATCNLQHATFNLQPSTTFNLQPPTSNPNNIKSCKLNHQSFG
ncbi:MAG: hypothetical protein F6K55_36950 [Moorea sp. SIO4A3]|nr:hypothetical protein [Moorena sp. SIO4A3]